MHVLQTTQLSKCMFGFAVMGIVFDKIDFVKLNLAKIDFK
jgi:hypothetical protein